MEKSGDKGSKGDENTIEDRDVNLTIVIYENDEKNSGVNDAKSTLGEDDGKFDVEDAKSTHVDKKIGFEDAKSTHVEDDGKSSDVGDSKSEHVDGKSSVEEVKLTHAEDGKRNDAMDAKSVPVETSGSTDDKSEAIRVKIIYVSFDSDKKSNDVEDAKLTLSAKDDINSGVSTTRVSAKEEISDTKDSKSSVFTEGNKACAEDDTAHLVSPVENLLISSTYSPIEHSTDAGPTVEGYRRAVMQGARPKTKSNIEQSSEKSLSAKKSIKTPDNAFYELGLIANSVSKEPAAEQEENAAECASRTACTLDESHKLEGKACFNWLKKVTDSPQKLMSKLKKRMSPKAPIPVGRPIFSSLCHADDPCVMSPGLSPIGSSRHFVLAYLGRGQSDQRIDRIDYSKLAEDKIIPAFLGMHPCYDVMPTSGKVIVLSVELLVKNAFGALVANEIKAAPLWDTGLHDFVGMLTISDFINVLRHYFYSSPEDIKDIENQAIATWRRITQVSNKFIKINGLDSLAQATKLLIQEGVHRIPVFDEKRKCVLFVLTRKRLLQYLSFSLFENFDKYIKTPSFFRKTLRELKVGTFENIATTKVGARVIDALDLFVNRKVSSLPVVDDNGILKDIFEKFDVFALAKEQTYHNLEMTVLEAITKAGTREGAIICTLDESLGTVINRFVNNKAHRIVVIDERRTVIGIISLSDVLKFLVVQPLAAMEDSVISAASDTIEEGTEGAVGGSDAETSVFDYGEQDSSTDHLTEESDKNGSSVLEAMTDLKISPTPENPEEKLDGEDVPKCD